MTIFAYHQCGACLIALAAQSLQRSSQVDEEIDIVTPWAGNGMISIFVKQRRRQARWYSLAPGGRALAILVILHALPIDLAAAQSPAPQPYRIMAAV